MLKLNVSYENIFASLKSRINGLCDTPELKQIVLYCMSSKNIAFLLEDIPVTHFGENNFMIVCDAGVCNSLINNIYWILVNDYVSVENAYSKLLTETNFNRSITYNHFKEKLIQSGLTKNAVFYCKECTANGMDVHYYVNKQALKRFVVTEYKYAYESACPKDCVYYGGRDNSVYLPRIDLNVDPRKCFDMDLKMESMGLFQNYMKSDAEYNPNPSKMDTLKGLIKTLVKLQQSLVKQQESEYVDKNRENRIKEKILNVVSICKTQSAYFKSLFNKDINVLVNRYATDNWMSLVEIQQFFGLRLQKQIQEYCH